MFSFFKKHFLIIFTKHLTFSKNPFHIALFKNPTFSKISDSEGGTKLTHLPRSKHQKYKLKVRHQ